MVDRRWWSELKEQSPEAAEGPRCWQGCHDKTDEVLLQTLSLNGAKWGSQWYPKKKDDSLLPTKMTYSQQS